MFKKELLPIEAGDQSGTPLPLDQVGGPAEEILPVVAALLKKDPLAIGSNDLIQAVTASKVELFSKEGDYV